MVRLNSSLLGNLHRETGNDLIELFEQRRRRERTLPGDSKRLATGDSRVALPLRSELIDRRTDLLVLLSGMGIRRGCVLLALCIPARPYL